MFVHPISNNQLYNIPITKNIQNANSTNNATEVKYTGYAYPVFEVSFQANLPQKQPSMMEQFEGCIMGGAIGDAFGAPLEQHSMQYIEQKFDGKLYYLLKNRDNIAEFTDDTQMVLFTMEGLIQAFFKYKENDISFYKEILKSYQNWYKTQTETFDPSIKHTGLLNLPDLYKQKAPGVTCLSALQTGELGTTETPINNSAGNGGVMRVAPVGLLYKNNAVQAFEVAKNIAALTHGNPNGYLPAGFLASLIAHIAQGYELDESIEKSINILKEYDNSEQTISKIKLAQKLAKENISDKEAIRAIGDGWTGDEALSIALYSNLRHTNNFKRTIVTAANHDGDSDTTAAIAGNISGMLCGINNIPSPWKKSIEMNNLLSSYSKTLCILSDSVFISSAERQQKDAVQFHLKPGSKDPLTT